MATRHVRRLTRRGQRGQAIILLPLVAVVLLGFVGLAVDVGQVLAARRSLARLTDAAALAAAAPLSAPPSVPVATRQQRARTRAREYLSLHDFDPDATGNTYAVAFPTTTPPRKLVSLSTSRQVRLAFMPVLGISEATVSASAQGEAAPLDVALVQDVSASQCEQNYNTTSSCGTSGGWCSCLHNAAETQETQQLYRADRATTDAPPPASLVYPPVASTNIPWAPFYQQQDAARFFIDHLDPVYDQVALVSFSSTVAASDTPLPTTAPAALRNAYSTGDARLHQPLTNLFLTPEAMIGRSPATVGQTGAWGLFPAGTTNMARGIYVGLTALTTFPPARQNAMGTIVLFSDGSPTRRFDGSSMSGCSSAAPERCAPARQDAMTQTDSAIDKGIVIYTIFAGSTTFATDHALILQWIADKTDNRRLDGTYTGTHDPLSTSTSGNKAYEASWFRANVSDNYYLASDAAQLQDAYEAIFEKIYTRLTK